MNKTKNIQLHSTNRSLGKKITEKGYSLHHLHALNNKLESEKQQRKKLLEKMKQDKAISNKIEAVVEQSIEKIQSNGVYFAAKMQEERRKHIALTTLVNHYQALIYKQKLQSHNQMIKTKQIKQSTKPITLQSYYTNTKLKTQHEFTQNAEKQNIQDKFASPSKANKILEQQIEHLKKFECQYEEYILKNNRSEYELQKKLDEVRTNRSERTVFNKIFDQLQQELFQHQFNYKKLVIERTILQKQFQEKVRNFQNLAAKAQRQYNKILKNTNKQPNTLINITSLQTQNLTLNFYIKQPVQQTIDKKQMFNDLSTIRNTYGQQLDANTLHAQDTYIRLSSNSNNDKKVNFKQQYHNHTQYNTYKNNLPLSRRSNKPQPKHQIKKQLNLLYQKKVKQIYQQLKIISYAQIPIILDNLQYNIQQLYIQQQQLASQLYEKDKCYQNFLQVGKLNGNQMILNQNLRGRMVGNFGDQNRMMEEFIRDKQNLRNRIRQVQNNNDTLICELKNFTTAEMEKLHFFQKIKCSQSGDINQDQVNLQQIVRQMSELQSCLSHILLFSPQKLTCCKKINETKFVSSNHNKTNNIQKQTQNLQNYIKVTSKDNNLKKDGQKYDIQSIPNINHNAYKQKQKDKEKEKEKGKKEKSKSGYNQNKQHTQLSYRTYKLQQILHANRITHNTMSIYSQQQLMQISRRIINKQRNIQIAQNQNINHLTSVANNSSRSNKPKGSNFFIKAQEVKDKEKEKEKYNKRNQDYHNFQ